MKKALRKEADILKDLQKLCGSSGFAHVIAYYCYKDSIIRYGEKLVPEDIYPSRSSERLIRTEISTLIGFMYKEKLSLSLPSSEEMQNLINNTDTLLQEAHDSLYSSLISKIDFSDVSTFESGFDMREPIFYTADSAYSFQYIELAAIKYSNDNAWLINNKGFSIEDAKEIIKGISKVLNNKLQEVSEEIKQSSPRTWSVLPGFIFTVDDIIKETKYDKHIVHNVIKAFCPPQDNSNQNFNALSDFNVTNAYPIMQLEDNRYLLFQYYSLCEAFYETPFYWFCNDANYFNEAMKNRGSFTEQVCREKLEFIFGKSRVWSNISILDSKKNVVGEIDVLAIFADRAIVLQAKSKKLTLEARKGNDNAIKDDFKKSIQDSYEQAISCSKLIVDKSLKLQDADFNEIDIPRDYNEIYVFCVVSDHYPALNYQVEQFLKYDVSDLILPPFIMDVFLLDVMAEMLNSPLRFLSYVNRRTSYFDSITANELTILSYHLQTNLWLKDEQTKLYLLDDICSDLDAAMLVRREGLPGSSTPEGILTNFRNTVFEKLIADIEEIENPMIINLGFFLLKISKDSVKKLISAIKQISERTLEDDLNHDATILFGEINTGLTMYSNFDSEEIGAKKLYVHCELKKYSQKIDHWFGLCIDPNSLTIKYGLELDDKWEKDEVLEESLWKFNKNGRYLSSKKIGRNSQCPCGSGKKFKKCCGK